MTSRDVALAAGVSQTTVSFVLNGRQDQGISVETRDNVLAQARALGYVPSAAARSLRMGTSSVVLCILPDWPVTQAMEEFRVRLSATLARAGLSCVYFHQLPTSAPTAALWQQTNPAVVVAFGELGQDEAAVIQRAGIALINGVFGANTAELTGLDQTAIGARQVQHLAERGHRRIAFCAPADDREARFARPRADGARQACIELGLDELLETSLDTTPPSARNAVAASRTAGVTAIAASNDLVALAVLDTCRFDGLGVPSDLAVIGVDDLAVSSLVYPRLTSIAINLSGYAIHLARQIVDKVPTAHLPEGPDPAATEYFTVVERDTTR
ncbi:LacI family DNA-binding transcriptional regulator [Rhodococcus qingshengii]|uniref:LacI family DNA-binding transcriptional regulator n=1 Tax=Rhodococcus qingshengii TaxID=334542 RepID=UPI001BEB08D3|nr:LacI family DNA-binding transcriptional regulator [Rhodococcus qingshengii]MBT2273604.1 LacI family DNA-binding transcriptional regulator [Rhodococcus qingshengii]